MKVGSRACRSGDLMEASNRPPNNCLLLGSCASPELNVANASPYRPRHCSATPCRKYAFGHCGHSSRAFVASCSESANWPCFNRAADRLLYSMWLLGSSVNASVYRETAVLKSPLWQAALDNLRRRRRRREGMIELIFL